MKEFIAKYEEESNTNDNGWSLKNPVGDKTPRVVRQSEVGGQFAHRSLMFTFTLVKFSFRNK